MQNPFRKMEKEGDQHMPRRTFSLQPVNYTQNDERHDKMIMSPRQKLLPPKQEKNTIETKIIKASPIPRTWLGTKDNPRIVRVPRCFGGKDRHSKVYTIKGLRDRRIRLSVPTAIQLYDLQNRLGLNQPSKAVDWLLNATKHEIDKLPPLQVVSTPQTSFLSLLDATMKYRKEDRTQSLLFCKGGGLNINNNGEGEGKATLRKSTHWSFDSKNKCKEVINEQDDQTGIHSTQFSVSNPFLSTDQSSLPSLLNNVMPYNSYNYHWDPSNLCLSHLGSHGYTFHMEDPHNYNAASLSSSLTLPYLFPPYVSTPMDVSPSLYSISPPMRPFQLSFPPKFLHPQNNSGSLSDKENCNKD